MKRQPDSPTAPGALLAALPSDAVASAEAGAGLPSPESLAQRRIIRSAAIVATLVSAAYLLWRAAFTVDPAVWWVALPMLFLEGHHALGLTLYSFSLWNVDPPPAPDPVHDTDLRVAVLIPTYDESIEILLPVITAAVDLEPDHVTWVLDDGRRPEVERLAESLGARYLTRPDNSHAKAGNLNHALGVIDADLIAVLDADHVALPGFLVNTLGYFHAPDVAVVQTPQDFYNADSFEHENRGEDRMAFSEQAVFYRVILPAKNHWNAGFWCGTGAVIRVAALEDVGGVATDSVTEDIHTSIRLHKRGWRIVVHNEVLARGLAAEDARSYMIQRERWARGAMQVMRSERLLTSRELTFAQRVAYLTTLFGWFDSLRTLFFILLPIVVLMTGALPIDAPLQLFGPAFLLTFLLQFVALRLLARGRYPPILSVTFETLRLPAVLPALVELVTPRRERRFRVTPKGASGLTDRRRSAMPPLLTTLVYLSLGVLLWSLLTLAGLTPLHYGVPTAIHGTALFLAINLGFITLAMRRIRAPRFAGERRAGFRFSITLQGEIEGRPVGIVDLSFSGAGVIVPPGAEPRSDVVQLVIPAAGADLRCVVVRRRGLDNGATRLGVEFVDGQWQDLRGCARLIFHGRTTPSDGDATRPASTRAVS